MDYAQQYIDQLDPEKRAALMERARRMMRDYITRPLPLAEALRRYIDTVSPVEWAD